MTWVRSRFPGTGIHGSSRLHGLELPELLAGPRSRGWSTLDADANNSLAPSSAHGEGKVQPELPQDRAKRSPGPSPVPKPVQTSAPSSLPSPQLHLLKAPFTPRDFRLKRKKMRVPGVCCMLSSTDNTTHTDHGTRGCWGSPGGCPGIVQSWQSTV